MIPVGWLAPSADCWDSNMLRRLTDGTLYPHGIEFKHCVGYPNTDDGCVLVVPGQYWHQATDRITEAIQRFEWVLLVRTADEEDLFDVGAVVHPRLKWWIQTPRKKYPDCRVFGVGFPPHFNDLPAEPPEKLLNVFLSAQNTHDRRRQCFEALQGIDGRVEATAGFTQGMDPAEYVRCMSKAKVAPAPSGAVSCDSFRVYEALEAHTVPIVDTVSPVDGLTDYWTRIFPGYLPFPTYTNPAELKPLITQTLSDPAIANRVAAFWMRYKRQLAHWLRSDLEQLGAL